MNQGIVFGVKPEMVEVRLRLIHHGSYKIYTNNIFIVAIPNIILVGRFSFTQPTYIAYQTVGDETKSKGAIN